MNGEKTISPRRVLPEVYDLSPSEFSSVCGWLMVIRQDSTTLVLVCRRAFRPIIERVLHREGFGNFQHGNLSLIGGSAVEARVGAGASEVFVLMTDVGSAMRLVDILGGCPIRPAAGDLFELYTVGD